MQDSVGVGLRKPVEERVHFCVVICACCFVVVLPHCHLRREGRVLRVQERSFSLEATLVFVLAQIQLEVDLVQVVFLNYCVQVASRVALVLKVNLRGHISRLARLSPFQHLLKFTLGGDQLPARVLRLL